MLSSVKIKTFGPTLMMAQRGVDSIRILKTSEPVAISAASPAVQDVLLSQQFIALLSQVFRIDMYAVVGVPAGVGSAIGIVHSVFDDGVLIERFEHPGFGVGATGFSQTICDSYLWTVPGDSDKYQIQVSMNFVGDPFILSSFKDQISIHDPVFNQTQGPT